MTTRPWIAGLLGALLSSALAWPAYGEGGTSASCVLRIPAKLSPGFSPTSRSGTYGTEGETGTILCLGTVGGHRVTGPGTFEFEGTYSGDCFGNVGSGTYVITLPTEVGPKRFTGSYTERRTGFTGPVEASQPGGHFRGRFLVLPAKGDCFTTPLTEVVINMAGTFA